MSKLTLLDCATCMRDIWQVHVYFHRAAIVLCQNNPPFKELKEVKTVAETLRKIEVALSNEPTDWSKIRESEIEWAETIVYELRKRIHMKSQHEVQYGTITDELMPYTLLMVTINFVNRFLECSRYAKNGLDKASAEHLALIERDVNNISNIWKFPEKPILTSASINKTAKVS